MNKYTKLCQIVDTIKLHLYHGDETTQKVYSDYVSFIESLKVLKSEAQLIHHSNNDMRFVNTNIGGSRFRVMATTVRGFGVTLQNQDVSISLKTLSSLKKEVSVEAISAFPDSLDENEAVSAFPDEYIKLSENPIIKIEFRSSFLARVGHTSAINYVLKIIENNLLSNYKVKVSELHLATDIQGYDFSILDYYRFKTRKRTNSIHDEDSSNTYFHQGRKFTGFSFGKGDEMLRIYNKSVEIKKNPDKAFIRDFAWCNNPDYNPDNEVWRIEIQYRREKLKTIYDSVNGLLDGFTNVLDSIPSLWDRALQKVELTDLKHDYCLDSMLGYTIIDNVRNFIDIQTIRMRIYRADTHSFWSFLKGWFHYKANDTNVYTAPKTGAFQWVSNSIKSLFSTLLKYEGDINPQIVFDAVNRADVETKKDKQISLIDNAYLNSLSYLGECEILEKKHGVLVSGLDELKYNVSKYVSNVVKDAIGKKSFDTIDENLTRMQIFNKELRRYVA